MDIYENSIYMVEHKPDPSASLALQAIGATKYPGAGVADGHGFPVYELSDETRIFITGFNAESPLYANVGETVKKTRVAQAQEVLKKYRKLKGDLTLFNTTENPTSISKATFMVYDGQTLHTDNADNAMNLYVSLLAGYLCPKGKEGAPEFVDSNYVVLDATGNRKETDSVATDSFAAMDSFNEFLKQRGENDKLVNVLYYMDINLADNATDEAYQAVFVNRILQEKSRLAEFTERAKEVDTNKGFEKLEIYKRLSKMKGKSPKLTKQPMQPYFYNSVEVGADLKGAAINIAQNPSLAEVKEEILGG